MTDGIVGPATWAVAAEGVDDSCPPAPPIVTLPNLDFSCERCGIRIHHDSDPALVRAVAVHHNVVAHRSEEFTYGSLVIRWQGFAPPDVVDRLTEALFERFGGLGVDLWVDNMEAAFAYLEDVPGARGLETALEIVARFAGPDLEVIDRR